MLSRNTKQSTLLESEMKFQALSMAKEIHTALASITFIEMLSVMSGDNPAKKEVQELETALNLLTTEVGEFIQKYIPDVADADAGDTEEYAEPAEPIAPKKPNKETTKDSK